MCDKFSYKLPDRKLTQEELERREKETKLTEVDSKALRSDEELRALKQKIRDVEEEMQQNEQTLRNEVRVLFISLTEMMSFHITDT